MNNANFSKTFLIWKLMFKINQIWIERKQDSKQHHYRKTPICHNTVYKLSLWLHLWVAAIKLPLIDNIHVLHLFNDAIFPEGFSKSRIRISIHLSSQIYAFKHVWGFETKALWTDRWTDRRMDGPSYRDARMHLRINLKLFWVLYFLNRRELELIKSQKGVWSVISPYSFIEKNKNVRYVLGCVRVRCPIP